jgi:hypothetical protein
MVMKAQAFLDVLAKTVVPVIGLQCLKCGTEMTITPVDESDRFLLLTQPFVHEVWTGDDYGPGCPLCQHHRGGYYPLQRVPRPDEEMTLALLENAIRAKRLLREPEGELPDNCTDEQEDAYCAAWDAIDDAEAEVRLYETSLELEYGYPKTLVYDIEDGIDDYLNSHRVGVGA